MTKNKVKERNNKVGAELYTHFSNLVQSNHVWLDKEQLERKGTRLILQSPYVTESFKTAGFDMTERHLQMNIFKPNVALEDYAVFTGDISKITLETSEIRAQVTAERVIQFESMQDHIKRNGIREHRVYECVREAALRELMQVAYIGRMELGEKALEAATFAVVKRIAEKNAHFRSLLEISNVDWRNDIRGVVQFAAEMDFSDFVQTANDVEPYYNRRVKFTDIARSYSTIGKSELNEMSDVAIIDNLLLHLMKRSKRVEGWMRKAFERAIS